MYSPLSPCPLPRKGWHRVAVLGAWMPNSDYIYRNTLLSIASKMSQCEHGCVGKRALGETKARHCLGRAGHAIRQGAAQVERGAPNLDLGKLRRLGSAPCPWSQTGSGEEK